MALSKAYAEAVSDEVGSEMFRSFLYILYIHCCSSHQLAIPTFQELLELSALARPPPAGGLWCFKSFLSWVSQMFPTGT